ncbi:MAG: UDP-N-acetylglucosamine 2-epimerase (non-hydrolyzing) [Candidatus Altiarchaeales archaeon ex4484_96]|nr:MAG: UDP-N-acetylglucosamine 2-epimerase (non-hydrolyzing) [Candidatus Altiarchaeales archaeon ex4484_96]
MKITIIVGTRPEIIKMSPLIRVFESRDINYFILHTGQHYSYNMDRIFFEQLQLPDVKYNLDVGSGSHAKQTSEMLLKIESVLKKEKPDLILVEGDTNTVLSGALAASKSDIKVGHVEAGLRSYDRGMPEEVNRVLTDHCSDLLFAPTVNAYNTLIGENISSEKVYITGNTIVDAVKHNLRLMDDDVDVLSELGLEPQKYFLLTLHRQENVDDRTKLKNIFLGLEYLREFGLPIVYPVHPRTRKRLNDFGLESDVLNFIEPVDYFRFLQLEKHASLVLTDSGGVQEESCILGVPCVTLRENTERPETLDAGSNMLAGADPRRILECAGIMLGRVNGWDNPFGDGKAGEQITNILESDMDGN